MHATHATTKAELQAELATWKLQQTRLLEFKSKTDPGLKSSRHPNLSANAELEAEKAAHARSRETLSQVCLYLKYISSSCFLAHFNVDV